MDSTSWAILPWTRWQRARHTMRRLSIRTWWRHPVWRLFPSQRGSSTDMASRIWLKVSGQGPWDLGLWRIIASRYLTSPGGKKIVEQRMYSGTFISTWWTTGFSTISRCSWMKWSLMREVSYWWMSLESSSSLTSKEKKSVTRSMRSCSLASKCTTKPR